jgi:hypothetical protein
MTSAARSAAPHRPCWSASGSRFGGVGIGGVKATSATPWWRDAVFYHVYVRSFQDSNADGIGDLRGVVERLDHIVGLGVDAVWLSPIHPSPLADLGYDITDYTGIDPALGSRQDFDDLVAACHSRGLRLLLDLVASHTSIEHPWFRDHPERYIWSEGGPANNWRSAFGGPAWSRDELTGRWYLHSPAWHRCSTRSDPGLGATGIPCRERFRSRRCRSFAAGSRCRPRRCWSPGRSHSPIRVRAIARG